MPRNSKVEAKSTSPKKPIQKTDVSKIRTLEEQLAQREAELAVINGIQTALASKMDFQGIIDTVGDKLNEIFKDGNIGIGLTDKARNAVHFPYAIENGKRLEPVEISLDIPSLMQHITKRRRPLLINSKLQERFARNDAIKFPGREQRNPKSWLTVPFFKDDEVIGGMSLRNWERENAYNESDVRLLQTIANSMIVALENARLLKETEQRATELQIIDNIGQILNKGVDLSSMVKHVAERLHEVLKVENIAITIHDPNTGHLIVRENYYIAHPSFAADRFSLKNFKFLMRLSARGGGRSWVVNTNAEKSWRKYGGDLHEGDKTPKSFVALPLLAGGDAIGGIIFADYEKEHAFSDLPIRMLETIASNMGTAIQNVRLFEETQRLLKETDQRATELQIINNIGQTLTEGGDLKSTIERVGERLREALKVENIGFSVWDEKLEHIVAKYYYRNGKPASSETWKASDVKMALRLSARGGGRSWVVNRNAEKSWRKFGGVNEADAPKSFVQLPLLAGGKLVGGITLADYEKEDAFTNLSVGMLETIASNMGTAIQNARLFDETQRLLKETEQRATELQIINNIGQTLTEGLDLQSTLERVGERLREALDVKSMGIIAFDSQKGIAISNYFYHYGKRFTPQRFSMSDYKFSMRMASRAGGKPWVVNTNVEKNWNKFVNIVKDWTEIPKAFVNVPLLAGGELVGSITIADYENENAFVNLPLNLLETIASNMGTAIQNVRLFDETKRLFEEAEEARAAAEHANKAKSTFLANMSHELRTPLNAIMGFTSIVRRKAEGVLPEKQTENLDKVLSSSQHLLGLINTALDIAKIEAGRMDVIPAKFSLSTLVDQCATLAAPLFKSNVTLEKQLEVNIGLIFSDQDKIKQIVLNLLSNAAKFTHDGKILLSVQKVNKQSVNISVTDSGIGISKEALGRVFEEFQQADTSTTREYGGTGLGLTISRNLARLLGGDLTATSELGKGSTFTLTLPIQYGKKTAASPDTKPDSAQSTESQSDDIAPIKENGGRDSLKTILIVEDTELNINLLTQLLEDAYNLLIANDGAQGVSMAQESNPDLILMDVSLPIMDGYEATRRIRMTMTSTPIIGLSAHAMSGDEEKAKEAGCNDYLTKPVNEDLLIQKLNQYLR